MRLSVWAELQGISYKTAWRMWKAKTLPVPAYQLATGTVVVDAKPQVNGVALYARGSPVAIKRAIWIANSPV